MKEYRNKRNPILPIEYHIPDGEAHVMPDGRLYIYGSYDQNDEDFCSEMYTVVSTGDMENWIIHNTSFTVDDIPWLSDPKSPRYQGLDWMNPTPFLMKIIGKITDVEASKKAHEAIASRKKIMLFAPDAIHKNGVYYLYFCTSDEREGVAVSNYPEGPFHNPIQLPCGGIDPAIFIDDDGKAYYYWGQCFAHGVELNSDMTSFDKESVTRNILTEEDHFFHEGASMRKIGSTYYLVYSSIKRGKPTSLAYATSQSPLGPFVYRGIIIDNEKCDPSSWNNHGSIEKFRDQWYVFYHRSSRGTQKFRRLCIEPIEIMADGTIPEVKMTSQGIGVPFTPNESIKGYQACELSGDICINIDDTHGEKLTKINNGDYALFRFIKNDYAYTSIKILASGSGVINVFMDSNLVGTIEIDEGYQKESSILCEAGKYELLLQFVKCNGLEIYELKLN